MAHRNARLTVYARLDLVQQVEAGWPQTEIARQFRVSRSTVAKWIRRYRDEGKAGLEDRSSAPTRNPRLTPRELVRAICALRISRNWGLTASAGSSASHAPPSTPFSDAQVSTGLHGSIAQRERSCDTSGMHPGNCSISM